MCVVLYTNDVRVFDVYKELIFITLNTLHTGFHTLTTPTT